MAFTLMLMQSILAYNKRFTSVPCPGIRSVAAALASTINHFCKYETNVLSSHNDNREAWLGRLTALQNNFRNYFTARF